MNTGKRIALLILAVALAAAVGVSIYRENRGGTAAAAVPSAPVGTAEPAQTAETTAAPTAEPAGPDYGDPASWAYFALGEDKDVDVFLVCPLVDTRSERNAYDLNDKLKGRFVSALDMEKGIYEDVGRLYSPYYRQMSAGAYRLPEAEREKTKAVAYADVSAAFRWYLDHENGGRPLVLAGFSQGSEMCLELLKEFFGDTAEGEALRARLVTVFAIGWRVTEADTQAYPQIVPAQGEKDLGTVVSFDCEDGSLTETIILPAGVKTLSINPLNWKTDETPADCSENLGAVMSTGAEPIPALCGAYIGDRGQLVVTDVAAGDYPPGLDLFPAGAYHVYDYLFFFMNLKQNLSDRVAAYFEARRGEVLCQLLEDLLTAYEQPGEGDGQRIEADLFAVRAISEADYPVAKAVADHWRQVYLDPDYALCCHGAGDVAPELEGAGIPDAATHAFVVLGYELQDGEMTEELKGRCEAAAAAARSFPNAILVCSGGATGPNNPEKHTEAGLMKQYLVEVCGIEESRIFTDERAMTTAENAVNTFAIMKDQGVESMTIVTSSYHQRWGQALYNALAAIYEQQQGYHARLIGNYCFDTQPSVEVFLKDDWFAIYQLGEILKLPRAQMARLPDVYALLG